MQKAETRVKVFIPINALSSLTAPLALIALMFSGGVCLKCFIIVILL